MLQHGWAPRCASRPRLCATPQVGGRCGLGVLHAARFMPALEVGCRCRRVSLAKGSIARSVEPVWAVDGVTCCAPCSTGNTSNPKEPKKSWKGVDQLLTQETRPPFRTVPVFAWRLEEPRLFYDVAAAGCFGAGPGARVEGGGWGSGGGGGCTGSWMPTCRSKGQRRTQG